MRLQNVNVYVWTGPKIRKFSLSKWIISFPVLRHSKSGIQKSKLEKNLRHSKSWYPKQARDPYSNLPATQTQDNRE